MWVGWHRRQQDEVSLLQKWVREARCPALWRPTRTREEEEGPLELSKWFGSKEKREQVQEKMQDSREERARAEDRVLMEMTLVRGQREPQHQRAVVNEVNINVLWRNSFSASPLWDVGGLPPRKVRRWSLSSRYYPADSHFWVLGWDLNFPCYRGAVLQLLGREGNGSYDANGKRVKAVGASCLLWSYNRLPS